MRLCSILAALFLAARAGYAQDDPEKIKKKILEEVEKKLKAEEERILKEISRLIDEELAKLKKGETPSKVEPKKDPPKQRGFLGVSPVDLEEADREELGVDYGVLVYDVVKDGPAAKAGLQKGDVIVTIGGKACEDVQALRDLVGAAGAGSSIKVEYVRKGEKKSATITLTAPPDEKKTEPRKEEPKKEEPKKEEPSKDELRERVKKFLEKEEPKKEPKKEEPKAEGDDMFAFDDEMFEQIRPMLEQFGMNPEDYFEKGKDGKWRPNEQLREMFKQFDFRRFFGEPKKEEPKKEEPKKVEPKKEEPKKEEPKKEEPKSTKAAWLGVVPAEMTDEERAQLDLEAGVGLTVTEVMPGSPAEKAGLKKGDILITLAGKKVKGIESLSKFMATAKPGQEVQAEVVRGGAKKSIKVTLGERKD